MRDRLVDHEEFSAQRCFYHDAAVPINEKPAILFRQVSRDFAELFEWRLPGLRRFPARERGDREIIGFFEASTSEPENIPTEFTTISPLMAWVSLGLYKFSEQEIH